MVKRFAISIDKKDVFPKNETQDKKVYILDSRIKKLINIQKNSFDDKTDFLEYSREIFEKYGFSEIRSLNNKSKKTSQVNIWNQDLSFSKNVVEEKNYEVILHELAHGIADFYYGYNYADGHGELFVNILFCLIRQYTDISSKQLEQLADEEKVKYFYNLNNTEERLNEKDFLDKLNHYEKAEAYLFLRNRKSKLSAFESKFFVSNKGRFCTFFNNNKGFYLYAERELLSFERDLYINPFTGKEIKKLSNLCLVSPIFKMNIDGRINKNGKYYSFGTMDFKKAKNKETGIPVIQIKEIAEKYRREYLNKHKKGGYKVVTVKSVEQYESLARYFIDAVS